MATVTVSTASFQSSSALRLQMEQLLVDFYTIIGIMPPRPNAAIAADLLAEDFQGLFFSRTTSETLVFNKSQLLASNAARSDGQPSSELLSLNAMTEENGVIALSYSAAFRVGHTVTVRRGSLKAARAGERWMLRAVEEDVRVFVIPEASKPRGSADRPRIWIV
jgi:hypothetical protein